MTSQGNSAWNHAPLPSRINKQLSAQGGAIDPMWEFDAYGNYLRWLYLQKKGNVRAGIFSHFPLLFLIFILFFLSRHTYRQCASESTGLLSCSFPYFLTMWFLHSCCDFFPFTFFNPFPTGSPFISMLWSNIQLASTTLLHRLSHS